MARVARLAAARSVGGDVTNLMRIAAWFFLAQGAFYLLIGALTPVFVGRIGIGPTLFFTPRSDSGYFGDDTADMLQRDPDLGKLRDLLMLALAGLLAALGLAVMGISWFGLRAGQPWAYWSLVATGAAAVPYWVMIVLRYVASGASVTLADVPPFMWVTTALWLVGVLLGGLAIR